MYLNYYSGSALYVGNGTGSTIIATFANAGTLTVQGSTGNAGFTLLAGYASTPEGFHTGSTLGNCIQAPLGGVSARYLTATDSLFFVSEATPPASGLGQSRIYMNSG